MIKKLTTSAFALALLAMTQTAVAETTIVYNIFTPPTHFMWPVMKDWAAQVEEKSEGRMKVEFTAKSVAPPPKIIDAVRKGAADAGFMANIFAQKFAPGTGVSMVPWVHRGDSAATGVALWQVYQKHFMDKDKWKGVELLGLFHFAGATVCSVDGKPLDSIADIKEKKVWALPGTIAALMKEVGIAVVSGPATKIQEMVSRNVVDAYMGITYDAIDKFGAGPYTKYCIEFDTAPTTTNFSHFISKKVWDTLGAEDQQILRDLSGEHLARMVGKAINAATDKSKKKLEEGGMEVRAASAELVSGMEETSEAVIAKWMKSVEEYGVDSMAAIEEVRALTEELTEE